MSLSIEDYQLPRQNLMEKIFHIKWRYVFWIMFAFTIFNASVFVLHGVLSGKKKFHLSNHFWLWQFIWVLNGPAFVSIVMTMFQTFGCALTDMNEDADDDDVHDFEFVLIEDTGVVNEPLPPLFSSNLSATYYCCVIVQLGPHILCALLFLYDVVTSHNSYLLPSSTSSSFSKHTHVEMFQQAAPAYVCGCFRRTCDLSHTGPPLFSFFFLSFFLFRHVRYILHVLSCWLTSVSCI
jgi:hypothetical protein